MVWLRPQAETQELVRRANAILLLGHLKEHDTLRQAVALVRDRDAETRLRRTAFVVIGISGSAELIPELLDAIDENDTLFSMYLDTVGSLMTPETLPLVLPVLMKSTRHLSDAGAHIGEIGSREMLVAVLDYFLASPNEACDHRVAVYVQPVWKLLAKYGDEEILAKIGLLLANCERHRISDHQLEILPDILKVLDGRDPAGVVSRTALDTILSNNLPFQFGLFTVSRLCTPDTARWLLDQSPPEKLIQHIASTSNEHVREILRHATGGLVDAQDANRQRIQREETERRAAEAAEDQRVEHTMRTGINTDQVLSAFAGTPRSQWPELNDDRKAWLGNQVSQMLAAADAIHKVKWSGELQVTYPRALRLASELASHYGLALKDDVLLVHALLALEPSILAEYHRKRPLSTNALAEVELILSDPALPAGAVSHFVSFVQTAGLESPAIYDSLTRIAVSANHTEMNRIHAANTLSQSSCPIETLVNARKGAKNLRTEGIFLDALTERNHLPTIFERLNRLPADDQEMSALERPFPETTDLQWVGKIQVPEAWDILAELRRRLLHLELPSLVGVVESSLGRIDKKRLISLLLEQLADTPQAWREYTKNRAAEYERQLRFEQAAAITFDDVLLRLRETSGGYRCRLLCEGPNDIPVFKEILERIGLGAVSIQSVNGWANVVNPHLDIGPYLDGFQYAIAVLDGDNGRDLTQPQRPIKMKIQKVIDKLELAGVAVRVLMRYGIENYFSQKALEAVLGRDLSGAFALDETRPLSSQIGGYDKRLNVEVLRNMTPTDLDGTDLAEIIEEFRKRIEENT